jgi:FKBP-type peptidyl-prolyl cis-trans isomerase
MKAARMPFTPDWPHRPWRALVLVVLLAAPASADESAPSDLATFEKMGIALAQQMGIRELGMTEEQFAAFTAGFRAAYTGNHPPADESTRQLIADMQRRRNLGVVRQPNPAGPMSLHDHQLERFFANAREKFQLNRSPSGLLYRVQRGAGPRPRPDDRVVITIEARSPENVAPLPRLSGRSVRTRVSALLPGLVEGVQAMALGATGLFVLPPYLSFGVGEWPEGVEPGSPLLYYVHLEDIEPAAPIP